MSATGNSSIQEGATYTLNLSATFQIANPSAITGWIINWGDGTDTTPADGTSTSITHVFNTFGDFSITATAANSYGSYNTDPQDVQVTPLAANGSPSATGGKVYALNLSALVSPQLGTPVAWNIDWGDGSDPDNDGVVGQIVPGTVTSATHTYEAAFRGQDIITVTAIDANGQSATTTQNVQVNSSIPDLFADGDPAAEPNADYTLNLSAIYDDPTTSETAAHWFINWGDNTTSTATGTDTSTTHQYAESTAPRTIQASFTDDNDTYDVDPLSVVVQPAAPSDVAATAQSVTAIKVNWTNHATTQTGFTIERDDGSGDGFVDFATVDDVDATSYIDTTVTPGTTYKYQVRAIGAAGEDSDDSDPTDGLDPASIVDPAASIDADPNSLHATPLTLTVSGTVPTKWYVDWGDASTNAQNMQIVDGSLATVTTDSTTDVETYSLNVTHTYPANGTYAVKATVWDGFNGVDGVSYTEADDSVTVHDSPTIPDATISVDENSSVTFNPVVNATYDDAASSTFAASYTGIVQPPSNGKVTIDSDGSVTYRPDANYSGSDSFQVDAYDGSWQGKAVTVNVTVNHKAAVPLQVNPPGWNGGQFFVVSYLPDGTEVVTGTATVDLSKYVSIPDASDPVT